MKKLDYEPNWRSMPNFKIIVKAMNLKKSQKQVNEIKIDRKWTYWDRWTNINDFVRAIERQTKKILKDERRLLEEPNE